MTVPDILHPNDFRHLPKKVLRKFWREHPIFDSLRDQALNELINDPELTTIVSNLQNKINKENENTHKIENQKEREKEKEKDKQNNKENLSIQELVSILLLILFFKGKDKESPLFSKIKNLIKLINGDLNEWIEADKKYFFACLDDIQGYFPSNKELFEFKFALAALINSSLASDDEEKTLYNAIAEKFLLKRSTVEIKAAVEIKIKGVRKVKEVAEAANLSEQYGIHLYEKNFDTKFIRPLSTLLERKKRASSTPYNPDEIKGLEEIKAVLTDVGLSDTDKLTKITQIEAYCHEMYDGVDGESTRVLIKNCKAYFNPRYKTMKVPNALEYHVSIHNDTENNKIGTLHTLNIRVARVVKARMKLIYNQIVSVLIKNFKITETDRITIQAKLAEIMHGHYCNDVFSDLKEKFVEKELQIHKIDTLLHQLQALGYLFSDKMIFALDEEKIDNATLIQKSGKQEVLKPFQPPPSSRFSWFMSALSNAHYLFASMTGMQILHDDIHDVLTTVAQEIQNQRKLFFDTFKISPNSTLDSIKKNLECDVAELAPPPGNRYCFGLIYS